MKYRKLPVEIEARQFSNDASTYDLLNWANTHQHSVSGQFLQWVNDTLVVPTLEGAMIASPGDFIIRGVRGELYPCKPDIFAQTYEAVDG